MLEARIWAGVGLVRVGWRESLVAPGHFLLSASGVLGATAVSWAAPFRCPALATWVTSVI